MRKPAAATTAVPPGPAPRRPKVFAAGLGGAIGGAILATAVCYGLAYEGYWPGTSATTDQRLTALAQTLAGEQKSAADNAAALADVTGKIGALQSDVAAKLGAAATGLEALQQAVAKLKPPAPATDLAPLQAQLKTLAARVDAVAAGASSADAGALAANLATVQQAVADLGQKIAALGDRAGATDAAVQALKGELDAAKVSIDKAAAAPSPKTIASAMQLPLLLSAFEADLAGGRPYDADLKALVAAVPETHVPASVSDAATTGLPAPQELVDAFEAKMPAMMAARPPSTDASWQGQAADWFRNVLAVRQQGEQQGAAPDAVLSRLEAAIGRHDFAAAVGLFGQLPAPMQQAAGDVATQLRGLADAQTFIAGLRQQALAPATGVQQ